MTETTPRTILKDIAHERGMSYAHLMRSGGLPVVAGSHKRLSPKIAERIATALCLTEDERQRLAAVTGVPKRSELAERRRRFVGGTRGVAKILGISHETVARIEAGKAIDTECAWRYFAWLERVER